MGELLQGTRMLSQAVGYAATALGCVAAMGGRPALVRVLARRSHIPPAYLAKIVNKLARKRFVRTQRGLGGGVTLARPAREVTLFDLCVALDDPIVEPRCILGMTRCSDDRACPAHGFCRSARSTQLDFLRRTTIADIATFEEHRGRGVRRRKAAEA
jgi:Rrf2 family protein